MADFDIVIHGGRVIDGAGNPWFYADVGIKDRKIASIGRINPQSGQRAIAAKGMVITPGFVDMHTHSDLPLAQGRRRREQGAPGRHVGRDR